MNDDCHLPIGIDFKIEESEEKRNKWTVAGRFSSSWNEINVAKFHDNKSLLFGAKKQSKQFVLHEIAYFGTGYAISTEITLF